MLAKLPFTILIIVFSQAVAPMASIQTKGLGKCNEDWECGVGFYCSSNLCEDCVPCEQVFYRQSPQHSSGEPFCAKSVANCGDCLQRFQVRDESDQKCYPLKEFISSSTATGGTTAAPSAWAEMFFLGFLYSTRVIISSY